jgi:chondroitin synthase
MDSLLKVERHWLAPVVGVANDTRWLETQQREVKDLNLSVIIPYYKRPHTLKQTLYSLLNSDYDLSKIEVIIVDDGSSKDLVPDFDLFLAQDIDIKYVWQKDLGFRLSAARNFGLRIAKYDNLILLDCDLAVSVDFLKSHAWVLATSTNVISVGLRDSRVYDSTQDIERFKTTSPNLIGEFKSRDWRLDTWIEKFESFEVKDDCWRLGSGGNIGFHRDVLSKSGLFSEEFTFWGGEDLEWSYRAFKAGVYFHVNRGAHAYHFDCKKEEYQEDRKKDESQKLALLKELVPVYKNQHTTSGRVPFVSVFMTCYNKAPFILESINSVLLATKYRHEIVIVDDGSTDGIENEIQKVKKHPLQTIVFVKRAHLGAEATYFDCLSRCQGEYIVQLDADDVLLPNAIDVLIANLQGTPIDLAYGKYTRFTNEKDKSGKMPENAWVHPICDRYNSLLKGMYTHPLRVFKRRLLYRLGGFRTLDIQGAVDFSLYSQLLLAGYGVFVDVETYRYRQTMSSISNSFAQYQVSATRKVVEANLKALTHNSKSEVSEVQPKTFELFCDKKENLVFLKHLGLIDEGVLLRIAEQPHLNVSYAFQTLDDLSNKVYFSIQDAQTKKHFNVCLEMQEALDMYREYAKVKLPTKVTPAILKHFGSSK